MQVTTGRLLECKNEFAYLTKGQFQSGKTILRLTKIARQFWNEVNDAENAITEIYKLHGKYDETIQNYRVSGETIPLIEPEIKQIKDEVVEITGTKFKAEELLQKGEKQSDDSLPQILFADLLYKLDWLIELPEEE